MKVTLQALWASVVRTIVPIIVGGALALAVTLNIQLDPEFEKLLSALLTALLTAAYYVAVRLFETYISPKLGWLLGYAKTPDSYSKDASVKANKHTAE